MSRSVAGRSELGWQVYAAPGIPVVTNEIPPGQTERRWSPTSSTLICGDRSAVLVDALFTIEQAEHLSDWVARTGKALRAIYITHGHGDHFLGAGIVLERLGWLLHRRSQEVYASKDHRSRLESFGKRDFLVRYQIAQSLPRRSVVARSI
jgi:glyoxylase-like metal-dependent hydrolase (beta-lactamase superfamily II)